MPFIEKIFNPLTSFHHKRIFKYLKKLDIDKVIDILNKKFSRNSKITLLNYAADKEITNKKLQINKLSTTSSLAEVNENSLYLKLKNFLTRSKSNFINEYDVKTNTIDNVFKDINLEKTLLKIDVEGYEMNVINGSKMKLKEISYVVIENQFGNHYKNNNFDDIKDFLLKYNFVVLKKFIFPTMHYQDVLFKKTNLF